MDLKLVEDLAALQRLGSFVKAAQARHVTHPAFGRRIRSLEAWAGVPLVRRGDKPVALTPAGVALLAQAEPLLARLLQTRAEWAAAHRAPGLPHAPARPQLRIGTGRTLARTLLADWLARHDKALRSCTVEVQTASMAEVAARLERGDVDLLCCYEHPALSTRLSAQRFRYLTLGQDRLVPVTRSDAAGRPRHTLGSAAWIGYAPTLALGRLLQDHLARSRAGSAHVPMPAARIVCDSADVMLELALKGLGMAWLPWSLAAADCKRGLLQRLGKRGDEVPFEVRLCRPGARQHAALEALWSATER